MTLGYKTLGNGQHKVIALHGWYGDHTCYDPIHEALSTDEFTYAFPAYRGYGLSKHLSGEYSMREISADVIALADALGWKTFSLIGHSMGGKATQRVLLDAPERVRNIIAVTPAPACEVPFSADEWNLFDGAAKSLDNRRAIINFSSGNRLSPVWIDRVARYSAETSNLDAFAGYLLAWAKEDFAGQLQGNPIRMKVIAGEHDLALTADVMKGTYMAWFPNAQLEIMPNAGHYPMNETPIALATSMETFLRG
jgi:esterase